tara:strand:- start:19 stop:507 length:489 start_codon:yes stop_codon:yes gene_type:complete
MFEFLKEKGDALKNLFDKEDENEDTRSSVEKLTDFQEAKEAADIALSEEDKKIQSIEDTEETENIAQILEKESAKKEEESKEKELNEKLADIEKVISTFSSQTNLSSRGDDPFKNTKFSLNKPIDFNTQVAKNYIAPYLQQPTSQEDRIKLLFQSLKKQNLI